MKLRPYQIGDEQAINDAWLAGAKNVLYVLPTGGGKTVVVSNIIKKHIGASCVIAHRQELVNQISTALNRDQVSHRIIGPTNVVRLAVNTHMNDTGKSYYNPNAACAVAGVDTLIKRHDQLKDWCGSVTKWVTDEGHHLLRKNKWGKAVSMFPNAIGLGVTATPIRASGEGLGKHHDGVFDTMVQGPPMRALINAGYLTDYRIIAPPPSFLMSDEDIGSTGEYKLKKVASKFQDNKNRIIGDIVEHYLKFAKGKLGITFVPSVQAAIDTAKEFNARGVPAAAISSKTPDTERISLIKKLRNREILQLVNVDLFGEGFDLPAIEVVQMARHTASFALFSQQFGRALRLMISDILAGAWDTYTDEQRRAFIANSVKPVAMIIDHVGNIRVDNTGRHELPDSPRIWTLDRRDKRGKNKPTDVIPTRTCLNPMCLSVYERIYNICPFCGESAPPPSVRSSPEFVDGDLIELDAATLAAMRGEIAKVDLDPTVYRTALTDKGLPLAYAVANTKKHIEQQQALRVLREAINMWGGVQRSLGREDSESYKRFYWKFGVNVLGAQVLKTKEMILLTGKITND